MDFILLIIGMDANAYYMARCYHEKYGKKAYLIGKNPIWFASQSNIVIPAYFEDMWKEDIFLEVLDKFYKEHKDKKILLVSSTENYITMISKNKERLKEKFLFNYPKSELIDTVVNKELFYKTFTDNNIIDIPKTLYYDCFKNNDIKIDFMYPIIVKPADVVSYRQIEFDGKKKIYKVNNNEELTKTIKDITDGGYKSTLIIQEYIPGDDSFLFDSVIYSDKNAKVKRITFAQIGLQEHAYNLVGNAAVLINGYNQFGNTEEIVEKVKRFAESIGYTGYAEFDLKYDMRDKKFKLLEINPRQGRSSYYLTPVGSNLVEILVRDLVYDEELDYELLNKEVMLSFVPKGIIKKYIVNEEYRKKALSLWEKHVDPMSYSKDLNIHRKYILFRKRLRYYSDYKNGYWDNK
jgi:D-aspartate ligase